MAQKPHILTVAALFAAAGVLPAFAVPTVNLTASGTSSGWIDDVLFTRVDNQPTGTGVFKPFLTLQDSPIEQGYNTSGDDVFDTKRVPQWNHDLRVGDLATVTMNNVSYFAFELDANETGNGTTNKYLSIDNIAIFTSTVGAQTVETLDANNLPQFQSATRRYALNLPNTLAQGSSVRWVKIDATLGSTSGSGSSDMRVFIPTSYFGNAQNSDYVYFYNLNGVMKNSEPGTGSQAGFEEWRALTQTYVPPPPPPPPVPEGGSTMLLIGGAMLAVAAFRRRS